MHTGCPAPTTILHTSQAALIALTIGSNVHCVALAQLFDLGLDGVPTSTSSTGALGRKVLCVGVVKR